MHFLRRCWVFLVASQFVFGCAHKELVSDKVFEAKPGTIVHRSRRQSVTKKGMVVKLAEKINVKLVDGTIGFFVHFVDGRRVFLTREPFIYGKFNMMIGTLEPGVSIYTIPDMLTGVWRFASLDDALLLGEACAMFVGSEDIPFACVTGCWALPQSPQYLVPIIRPGGALETLESDQLAGLMYVKVKDAED